MPKFNMQDWFEGRMDLEPMPDNFLYEGEYPEYSREEKNYLREKHKQHYLKGAVKARFDDGEIDELLFMEIEEDKEKGGDMEVECNLKHRKLKWNEIIDNLPIDEHFEAISDEIEIVTSEFKTYYMSDGGPYPVPLKILAQIKREYKPDLKHLKGIHYAEIKRNYGLMKSRRDFDVTYYCYDSNRRAAWLYLKYLENYSVLDETVVTLKNSGNVGGEVKNNEITLILKDETRQMLYDDLKHYFVGQEELFYDLLVNNKPINEKLAFPGQQNVFVELFQRMDYNGHLSNTKEEVNDWIRMNFTYKKRCSTGGYKQADFEKNSVHNILKGDSDGKQVSPPKKKRLCESWLPFTSYRKIKEEKQKSA